MQGIGYDGQLPHDGRQNLHDVFAVLPHIGNKAGKCADAVGYKGGTEERRPCYAISNFGYSVFAFTAFPDSTLKGVARKIVQVSI